MVSMKDKLVAYKKRKYKIGTVKNRIEKISELLLENCDLDMTKLVKKAKDEGRLLSLSVEKFIPDLNQPRKNFDQESLDRLRISIETNGQLQPILVGNQLPNGQYPIIAGERRWRAICESNLIPEVIAIIRSGNLDKLHFLLIQIDENNQREQIPAIENAMAIKRVVDICRSQGKDQAYSAKLLNISPAKVSKHIALLDAPNAVIGLSIDGESQDVEVLYNLAKAFESKPKEVLKMIDQWRSGKLKTNFRKASKELANKTRRLKKSKREQDKSKSENVALKARKASDVYLSINEDEFTLTLEVGNKKLSFIVEANTVASLKNDINKLGGNNVRGKSTFS
ncbi:nucleoid occlusion protein [Candidatus Photodesmus blepharus]|uniref:Nucleoid occlusion protein n=1 Tax=Candidatus Photodesmus blepharonis TaxID=1179155 RepID=A0A084CND8_9GAMM|nr:ParB/RepB/Spo0J family partition protein [Candidatus Photodesmus blepharus]KEY91317.1 nucleoid occlusion protein [Candidatus Photodesmus blepharus]